MPVVDGKTRFVAPIIAKYSKKKKNVDIFLDKRVETRVPVVVVSSLIITVELYSLNIDVTSSKRKKIQINSPREIFRDKLFDVIVSSEFLIMNLINDLPETKFNMSNEF